MTVTAWMISISKEASNNPILAHFNSYRLGTSNRHLLLISEQ
jgi:hypothetical protein